MGLSLGALATPGLTAENVALVSGAFRRSIPVEEIEHLATTGEPVGLLKNLMAMSGQEPEEVSALLNKEISLPLVLTSRLINTRIGEAIIRRVARILYPISTDDPSVSIPAIRAAVINGLHENDGSLTAIGFLKAYPNHTLAINIPALTAVIEKAQSIAGLVNFFSDSPLDGLKESQP
ncbi:MAG: alpha/beta hydrolase [Synechococcus sp.]